ncbi:MAG: GatB/YqeY domain-containing protein [Acidobacteriota bacterium]
MKLLDQVNTDIANAMRAKEAVRLSALRMLKTALTNKGVEKGRELDENEGLQVVGTLIKQRRDSIEQFQRGGRQDLVDRETAEIAVLETYLPPPVGEAELSQIVEQAVEESGASSARDVGKVMKVVMGRLAGRTADGSVVNELVKKRLG